MNLDIASYLGVGPLRFGMTPDEAHQAVGQPRVARRVQKQLREVLASYDGTLVFEGPAEAPRLVQLGFGKGATTLAYGGVRLFEVPRLDAVRRLLQDDADAAQVLGFLVFRGLGLTMTGFHDGSDEDLAVTAFERGRWDSHAPQMRPFALP